MTDLIACLGTGKGTWANVLKLANRTEFQNVYLVVSDWTRQSLQLKRENLHLIIVNPEDKTSRIRDSIVNQLHNKIRDFEVAVNLESGSGKEHTALMTALMLLGLSFRFMTVEDDKLEEVSFSFQVSLDQDA